MVLFLLFLFFREIDLPIGEVGPRSYSWEPLSMEILKQKSDYNFNQQDTIDYYALGKFEFKTDSFALVYFFSNSKQIQKEYDIIVLFRLSSHKLRDGRIIYGNFSDTLHIRNNFRNGGLIQIIKEKVVFIDSLNSFFPSREESFINISKY